MMSQGSLAQPPFLATWLLELFAPEEHTESIAGDLLEEFSSLQAKSGVASARRWYWRQSTKTVVRLIGNGFRIAPWSIIGVVLGGFLLLRFGAAAGTVDRGSYSLVPAPCNPLLHPDAVGHSRALVEHQHHGGAPFCIACNWLSRCSSR
jgi:hypothetical protein